MLGRLTVGTCARVVRRDARQYLHTTRVALREHDPDHKHESDKNFLDMLRRSAQQQSQQQSQSQPQPQSHSTNSRRVAPALFGQKPYANQRRPNIMQAIGSAKRSGANKPQSGQVTIVLLLAGAGGVYYLFHLERVPETGRLRFVDVSVADEDVLGKRTYEETMQTYGNQVLSSSSPDARRVQRVANRILGVCHDLDMERAKNATPTHWHVHVIDSPEKNAFALPGGSIFVFTGILPVCENDDGLATVLSHEIAHVLARHPAEKMSGLSVVTALGFLMDMMGFDIGLSRMALNLLMSLPNSRSMESEADHVGLLIMAKACFDPSQAVSFWKRMGGDSAKQGSIAKSAQSILSTHPVDSTRVKKIQEWVSHSLLTQLPNAEQEYNSNNCSRASAFKQTVNSMDQSPEENSSVFKVSTKFFS